jgi:predicted Zn-dependent protease
VDLVVLAATNRGALLARSAEHAKSAIASFGEALSLSRDDPRALLYRARCLVASGLPEPAIRDLSSVISTSPASSDAFLCRAQAHHALGNAAAALVRP